MQFKLVEVAFKHPDWARDILKWISVTFLGGFALAAFGVFSLTLIIVGQFDDYLEALSEREERVPQNPTLEANWHQSAVVYCGMLSTAMFSTGLMMSMILVLSA